MAIPIVDAKSPREMILALGVPVVTRASAHFDVANGVTAAESNLLRALVAAGVLVFHERIGPTTWMIDRVALADGVTLDHARSIAKALVLCRHDL